MSATFISSEWQDFLGHAAINPDTPADIKRTIAQIVKYFDDDCLDAWAKSHTKELEKIREYADKMGYGDLDLNELAKFH